MSHKNLPQSLLSLLAALTEGDEDNVLTIVQREGESIEQAIERGLRAHAECCPGCAEARKEFEAAEEKAAARKKELIEKQEAAKHVASTINRGDSQDTRYEGKRPEMAAPYGAQETASVGNADARKPIGYMAFAMFEGHMRAIPTSFDEDRAVVEATRVKMERHPVAQLLTRLSGGKGAGVDIRPVYGE